MALAGRIAILAGGLGGLGSVTGRALRAQGASLAILYAPFEAARARSKLETHYGASSKDVRAYECDIISPASVSEAFASITKDAASNRDPPSILVNAAGYVSVSDMEETPPEETVQHLNSNVLGPMLVSQAFARMYFAARETRGGEAMPPGRIVSIGSQAAHVALPQHGAYCASKAALLGMTRCMASEWAGRGITANTVSPTVAWTELGAKAWANKVAKEAHEAAIPTGRFAQPEEVATAIAFLCQDDTAMINGADLRIDGGFTIR
ncbi:MAG: hypothetical protein M1828_001383 [Chrysothrix sp. TS-e1954]|nr:MAG: hypothetical protein M1828_001383 [Chrysothrix sp. TS-e1954]